MCNKVIPLLVDRNQLRKYFGITLSLAEIDRREARGEWPSRIKAGKHRNSRVFYFSADIEAMIARWRQETAPVTLDDVA